MAKHGNTHPGQEVDQGDREEGREVVQDRVPGGGGPGGLREGGEEIGKKRRVLKKRVSPILITKRDV